MYFFGFFELCIGMRRSIARVDEDRDVFWLQCGECVFVGDVVVECDQLCVGF